MGLQKYNRYFEVLRTKWFEEHERFYPAVTAVLVPATEEDSLVHEHGWKLLGPLKELGLDRARVERGVDTPTLVAEPSLTTAAYGLLTAVIEDCRIGTMRHGSEVVVRPRVAEPGGVYTATNMNEADVRRLDAEMKPLGYELLPRRLFYRTPNRIAANVESI